ncbi:hypothetical protein VN96_1215 [Lactococcus cremoris]|uniref:DUF722 domain-containing protein n=1 Tax=Lactococcus lactis TaxID=1358 RepID=UPI00062F7637|nr:DUF722 domain-containing protein [Lactococcus lactis]KKW72760.1 hypothetical protein VN96_1215 [Lactococcus cremoris]MDT2903334.1 DUF722 domain-containing protein [Lactococcus lactis]
MADKLDLLLKDYITGNLDRKIQSRINCITFKIKYKSKPDNLGIRTAYSGGSEPENSLLMKEKINKALDDDDVLNELITNRAALNLWWPTEDEVAKKALVMYHKKKWTWSGVAMEMKADRSTLFRRIDDLKIRIGHYTI